MEKWPFPNKRAKQRKNALTAKPAAKKASALIRLRIAFFLAAGGLFCKAMAYFCLLSRSFPFGLWITSEKFFYFYKKCEHMFDFFFCGVYNTRMHLKRGTATE